MKAYVRRILCLCALALTFAATPAAAQGLTDLLGGVGERIAWPGR
jgi:hypothetical protein